MTNKITTIDEAIAAIESAGYDISRNIHDRNKYSIRKRPNGFCPIVMNDMELIEFGRLCNLKAFV